MSNEHDDHPVAQAIKFLSDGLKKIEDGALHILEKADDGTLKDATKKTLDQGQSVVNNLVEAFKNIKIR